MNGWSGEAALVRDSKVWSGPVAPSGATKTKGLNYFSDRLKPDLLVSLVLL